MPNPFKSAATVRATVRVKARPRNTDGQAITLFNKSYMFGPKDELDVIFDRCELREVDGVMKLVIDLDMQ